MSKAASTLSVISSPIAKQSPSYLPEGQAGPKAQRARRAPLPQTTRKPIRTKASKKREEYLAYFVGVGCVVGLALSGIDSTLALNAFVHVPMWRAAMLATVIDGLLVGAELATLFSPCPRTKFAAHIFICMAGVLSICLNSAEFAQHGIDFYEKILCGAIGASIPLLVLVSSRYAGYLYLSSK